MKDKNSLPEHVLSYSVDFINLFRISNDNFVFSINRQTFNLLIHMKRNLFLLAVIILVNLSAKAQKINYGLTLGANISKINGTGIADSYSAGWFAGGFARIPLQDKWNLQPELIYNTVNSNSNSEFIDAYNINGNPNASNQIKLNYISLPVLVNYKVSKLFTIDAGPQYSFLVYDNENLILGDKATAFKNSDLGIVGGVQLNLNNVRFFGSYVWGITNTNNIDNRYKWYSRQAMLGLDFNLF
jgi:Outer membrane protein beta-barrel domain